MRNACAAPEVAEIGKVLGGYHLLECLGTGGFGRVFRARRLSDDVEVALKLAEGPGAEAALAREARTATLWLGNERIVRVLEVSIPGLGTHEGPVAPGAATQAISAGDDPAYIVLELMRGGDLRRLLDRYGALTERRVSAILQDVAEALAFAHSHGIVHGDVKPENILLTGDGRAKLADFGLQTREIEDGVSLSADLQSRLAPAGGSGGGCPPAAGTLRYIAPEVLEGKRPDSRADTYALGVVLFEMLTGRAPAGSDLPSDVRPGLGPRWDPIFRRCYTRIERRYESVRMVAREVALVYGTGMAQAQRELQAAATSREDSAFASEALRISQGRRVAEAFGKRQPRWRPGNTPAGWPATPHVRKSHGWRKRDLEREPRSIWALVAAAILFAIFFVMSGSGSRRGAYSGVAQSWQWSRR